MIPADPKSKDHIQSLQVISKVLRRVQCTAPSSPPPGRQDQPNTNAQTLTSSPTYPPHHLNPQNLRRVPQPLQTPRTPHMRNPAENPLPLRPLHKLLPLTRRDPLLARPLAAELHHQQRVVRRRWRRLLPEAVRLRVVDGDGLELGDEGREGGVAADGAEEFVEGVCWGWWLFLLWRGRGTPEAAVALHLRGEEIDHAG